MNFFREKFNFMSIFLFENQFCEKKKVENFCNVGGVSFVFHAYLLVLMMKKKKKLANQQATFGGLC